MKYVGGTPKDLNELAVIVKTISVKGASAHEIQNHLKRLRGSETYGRLDSDGIRRGPEIIYARFNG